MKNFLIVGPILERKNVCIPCLSLFLPCSSITPKCEWGDQFFFFVTIFQLEPWIGWSLDSHQLLIEETGLLQQSKNIKAFIRRYCKVL